MSRNSRKRLRRSSRNSTELHPQVKEEVDDDEEYGAKKKRAHLVVDKKSHKKNRQVDDRLGKVRQVKNEFCESQSDDERQRKRHAEESLPKNNQLENNSSHKDQHANRKSHKKNQHVKHRLRRRKSQVNINYDPFFTVGVIEPTAAASELADIELVETIESRGQISEVFLRMQHKCIQMIEDQPQVLNLTQIGEMLRVTEMEAEIDEQTINEKPQFDHILDALW